jgi:hypothetical protein
MDASQLVAGFQNNFPLGLGSSTSSLPGNLPGLADPLQQSMSLSNRSSSLSPVNLVSGSGVFTVGASGKVSFDYLFDGGAYEGELAIFSLSGMERWLQSAPEFFAREAALRALSNSDLGYIVISDRIEGARFSGSLSYEGDFNSGSYLDAKAFSMRPGEQFGVMLVPNGTVEDVLLHGGELESDRLPLFSIPTVNTGGINQFAQVVDIVADGNSFVFEDINLTNNSDRDYNDVAFQLRGAIGSAASLNDVTTSAKDWRNSDVGKQVETYAAANRYGPLTNIGSELASLFVEYETYVRNGGVPSAFKPTNFLLQVQGGQVVIDAIASDSANSLQTDLQALGLQQAAAFEPVVSGSLPIEKLIDAARLGSLLFAKPAYQPTTNVGATDSQGDRAMRSDVARTNLGVNGAGVTVGVLSDSFNNPDPNLPPLLTDAAADVNSGDLPAVNVLDDSVPATDEGRAMLQLIHDVAPGANLAFHTAYGGMANFAQGIIDLANAGADVIVDDVNTFNAPIFQDGIVAQAINRVVSQGVAYFTSAGNAGSSAYSSAFTLSGQSFAGSTGLEIAHDFDPGLETDTHQRITIPANSNFSVTLQWDSPWRSTSVSSPGSGNDVNIYLVSPAGNIVARSDGSEIGQDAIAVLAFNNDPAQNLGNQFDLVITNASGTSPGLINYSLGGGTVNEFSTSSPTIAWHRNAAGAETVGAAYYRNTPVFGTNPATLEGFSSTGTIPILFDTAGNRLPTPEIRQKPEIVAPDGANTTFFGGDSDGDGFPNFFGTSAAAPHAAAVAALMLQAVPGSSPINIYRALEETALGMGTPGFDNASGFGLIQADQAIARLQSLALPTVTISATDAQASESGDSAQFIINRSGGDINRELIVNYTFGSTATNGIDYLESGSSDLPPRPLSGTVLFRPGVTSTSISVTPINDNIAEGVETLDLTISQNLTYNIGAANQARATVVDDSLVIDRVLMSSTPQSGTWLYSFDASSGNSGDSFHIPNQEYEGNNLTVPMEDLQLPNITVGDVINFSMRLDDDEEDVTTPRAENQSSSSFIASFSGEQSFRFPDDWIYTIYWHMV